MEFKEYQGAVERTMNKSEYAIANYCMGLAGESGELIDMFKKSVFHHHALDMDEVIKELGDVMWYVSAIANEMGISLDEVAERNVAKLMKRYPNGFNTTDSIKRVDTK